MWGRRLQFAVLLEKNYFTEHFLEIFWNFYLITIKILRNLVISWLLVALQPAAFLVVTRRATFGKYIPRNRVLYKTVDWKNVLCYSTKMWFHRRYPLSNFQSFRKHLQRYQFPVQLQMVAGQLQFLKRNSTKYIFLGVFQNFQNSTFFEHHPENVWSDFF